MKPVYRDYDLETLERQYNVSRPELAPLRNRREERIARENAQVRQMRPRLLDLVYGIHARERLDFYPTEDRFAPLVVFFHGGYWRQRSKDQFAYLAPTFTDMGINFAAVGYPLAPEVRLADIVESCRRAIHWLLNYPSGLRFDPSRLHVAGHSAGAHLAAMMLATDWRQYGLPVETVKSATCLSGIYDLEPLTLVRPLRDLQIDRAEVEALSPLRLSPRHKDAPLIATVGDAENSEFRRQTEVFADSWAARNMVVKRPAATDRHHFNVLDELTEKGSPLNGAVLGTIRRTMRRRAEIDGPNPGS